VTLPLIRPLIRRHATAASVAVVAVVALLASCGGGDSATTEEAPGATKDEALAAKVPDAIKSDGKIVVGTDASYAPNEFLDTDGKTVIGFDVDLFDAVAQKLGLEAEFVQAPFTAIITGVDSGKYEMGVSSFTINDERKQQVNMISYFNAGTQWAVKKGNPAGIDPDNSCGKKVAVQTGTVQADEDLPVRDKKCAGAGQPKIQIDSYQRQDQATTAVVTGKDDAMLADSPIVAYAIKQTGDQLEPLGEIYDAAPYGYVVKKDQTEFAQALADAVKALIADGTYQKTLEKWGVEQGAIDNPAVNP
jgi:polar amino acid transport system substrate-binding protein